MEPVADYVQQIDRLLSAGAAMFPDDRPTGAAAPSGAAGVPPPGGAGGIAAAAQQADTRYRTVDTQIAELTAAIDAAVKLAAAQAVQAGIEARSIRVTANSQAHAINGATDGSDGVGALVSTMDERLAAMADHIASTRERLRATATQIRQLSVELSAAAAARS
jgi:hypothetical protein